MDSGLIRLSSVWFDRSRGPARRSIGGGRDESGPTRGTMGVKGHRDSDGPMDSSPDQLMAIGTVPPIVPLKGDR